MADAHGAGVLEYRHAEEAKLNFGRVFQAPSGVIEQAHQTWVQEASRA